MLLPKYTVTIDGLFCDEQIQIMESFEKYYFFLTLSSLVFFA
jgi:hypothetical protein